MRQSALIYTLFFLFLLPACSTGVTSQNNNSSNKAADSRSATKIAGSGEDLQKQIAGIASAARGRVGVKAEILETGETVSLNESESFPMQSVYKFPIAMAVLRKIDAGELKLEQLVKVEKSDFVRRGMRSPIRDENPNGVEMSINDLLRYAVSESDGTASDVLFNLAGGAQGIGNFLSEIKVSEINALNTEKEIGRDWETQYKNSATPKGAVELLRAFHERRGLSAQSQTLLRKLMIETPTGMKRLKGLLPKETVVAHKTGTGGVRDGVNSATNDIGIITLPDGKHLAIAVFVSDSPLDEAKREEVIAKIARAVWDKWSK